MKKLRILLFSVLLSFTIVAFNKNVKANEELPTPIHTITGDYDEVNDVYKSTLEISLGFEESTSGVLIQYQLFEGLPPSTWTVYSNPIPVQRRGNYRLNYRAFTPSGVYGSTQGFNIRVDIPILETYPNVIRNNQIIKHQDTGEPIILPEYSPREKEIRGVWVSTVSNIDIGQHTTDKAYKNEIISILNRVQSLNMNTVFFQVRSMNDAMYPSELAPYSRYIKGAQGLGLDWDILRFVIDEAHKRGLELHAWLNPYRVANMPAETTKAEMLATLHEDNFAKQNPDLVLKQTNAPAGGTASFILDPGRPEVRNYLNSVIDELLTNYSDVDGIHFDDYFYVTTTEDTDTFTNYNPNNLSLADWRRNNVDMMIKDVHDLVNDFNSDNNKKVKFGVSPGGIWANKSTHPDGSNSTGWQSYASLYADTRKWVKEEWLDYITPQLYWDFSLPAAPFAVLVDWWVDVVRDTSVDLIPGLGFYRYTDNTPWEDPNIIPEQLRYINQYEEITGHVTFSYRTFNRALAPVVQTIERLETYYWTNPVDFPWESDVEVILEETEEMLALKEDIKDIIHAINSYIINNDIKSDEGLTEQEKEVRNYFASPEALEAINSAIFDGTNVVENRFKQDVIVAAKDAITLAFSDFKDKVYEGSFDPNRGDAVSQLQDALDDLLVIRNLVKDSLGKQASELPKGEYFAPKEILDAVDSIIAEAEAVILDESSISSEINDVYHRLKAQDSTLRSSYFQGEMEENKVIVTFKNGDNEQTITILKGTTVTKPADPVKEGQIFVGWYLGDALFDFNTEINSPITLVATFEEHNIEESKEELETLLNEFKEIIATIETSDNRNPEELRKDHKYITPAKMEEINTLLAEIEELLADENATALDIIEKLNLLNETEESLNDFIVVGELESNYRQIVIIVGIILGALAIIGGAAIFVLVKKRK